MTPHFISRMGLVELLKQETTISPQDLRILPATIGSFALYRLAVSKYFLRPLSNNIGSKCREKFVHRGFDFIHYLTSCIIGTLAFMQQPYAHCPFYFADCRPYIDSSGPVMACSVFEKIYYFYFASYYLSDVFWIWTTKDVKMLIFHHTITISMIIACALTSRTVVGLSIMLLHDWVDVFLYCGKVFSYAKIKPVSDASFLVFAALFFYLRLFELPVILYIIWSDARIQQHHYWAYFFARVLLGFLYCCHLIWGVQIVKALSKIIRGDAIHDTRSDDKKVSKKEM